VHVTDAWQRAQSLILASSRLTAAARDILTSHAGSITAA
jgi:hypothetical protein